MKRCSLVLLAIVFAAALLPIPASAQAPVYLYQWGTLGTGDGQFAGPEDVAVDASGNVYVADYGNSRIQKFTSNGGYLAQWGGFNGPERVAVDANDNVYVADWGRIQKFTSSGTYVTQWGTLGSGDGQFDHPHGVAVDGSGKVYVADYGNSRIQVFDSLLVPTTSTSWGRIKSLYR